MFYSLCLLYQRYVVYYNLYQTVNAHVNLYCNEYRTRLVPVHTVTESYSNFEKILKISKEIRRI
jgi:hypothetical protein